jgi:type IV fimbrial biogenesis protein FimT
MFEGDSSIAAVGRLSAGFTLVELLVVMVVGAILLAIAVPSLQSLFAANQLTTLTDTFVTALNEARSEAAKLNISVRLSPTNGVDWSGGWTMAVVAPTAGMPTTLRAGAAPPVGFKLTSNVAGPVTFDPTGRAGVASEFVICQGGGPAASGASKMIILAATGSARIAPADSSGNPIDATGASFSGCTLP